MSTYGGWFCFENRMGKDIRSGYARYWNTDYGEIRITLDGLADGDRSLSKPFNTDSSSLDRWGFSATLVDGTSYHVTEKDCGFETSDSGNTVVLQAIFAGSDKQFYISMPSSSDCSGGITSGGVS